MSHPKLPYFRAGEPLRERVRAAVRSAPDRRPALWRRARLPGAVAAMLVLTATLSWQAGARRAGGNDAVVASVLSDHLRSLTPARLTDVTSTDRHTVKPWFAGKLDFSPPVVDLSAEGFPLVGGRLDFVAGRPAAALVYTRRNHVINVFVQPLGAGGAIAARRDEQRGYHVLQWSSGGMRFFAVSDLNLVELQQFRDLLEKAGG